MKKIFVLCLVAVSIYSCTKCVTCTAYDALGNVEGTIQAVKTCDKVDIAAYENGKRYTGAGGDTVTFKCK